MPYNLENKITYKELAPSLQELIDSKANKSDVDTKITQLESSTTNSINDLNTRTTKLESSTTNSINNLNNSINDLNTRTTKLESTSAVKVTAGNITNNQYIPIPDGYTREQCKYAVWLTYSAEVVEGAEYWYSSVDQNTGLVRASHTGIGNMPAQYLCIATKN